MIEKFLRAKHWHIFMLTFGLPFLIQLILMPVAIMGNNPMVMMKLSPIIMIYYIGGLFGWLWSIAIGLQRVIPEDAKFKVGKFKIFLLIPVVYMIFLVGYFATVISSAGANPGIFAIIFPLHLFSMFCIFYCMYFVAKTFKTAELQRKATFSDFAGEFFLIWFFPVGIWIIQPKINKLIENQD